MSIANTIISMIGKLPFRLQHPLRNLGRCSADRFDVI